MEDFINDQGIVTIPDNPLVALMRTERPRIEPIIFIEAEMWPYQVFYEGENQG